MTSLASSLLRVRPLSSSLTSRTLTSVRVDNGVAHITMDSPKTRNALSLEMMTRMTEDLSRAAEDKSVRSIVIRGEGTVRMMMIMIMIVMMVMMLMMVMMVMTVMIIMIMF